MFQFRLVCGAIVLTALASLEAAPAAAQLVPQPWVSVGAQSDDVTLSAGIRALNLGLEVGKGPADSVGVDVMTFFNVPLAPGQLSPYVGVGYYSDDEGVAVSGGVQVNPSERLVLGVGYHSIRGVNGQIGFRLF